ncbi:hypothetical protein [Legionella spiritensis]|uniref:Uncharacterized protein n=1 Tax=Legionella spiritensis TaxID=452 RepID=A0A0W0YWB6_LEGSP|nr:hypothetical protein [Legionella spiritensis]KTD61161.1 hypothetical protein Lspi_2781 [Legionella spiritensis]SNV45296.1 Uncharacterised protein [Legionella spiritensis]
MKFFLDVPERELENRRGGSVAEHYAWCLSQLDRQLNTAKTTNEKHQALCDFKDNMKNNPETRPLFENMENQFYTMLGNLTSDNEYIFNCLAGTAIDNQYLNYSK